MKNVLILGAGLVSRPIVTYLLAQADCRVVVATRTVEKAERLVAGHPRGEAKKLNLDDPKGLEDLIKEADVVVSLVPYAYHVQVSKLGIKHGTHVVTTSYVSPEMQALDEPARKAGVLVLNEIGLDPGIDHMSAMQIINRVCDTGGEVVHFSSCCGGLPAPEANDNPWGYKFSWSPRGVLLAGRNPAKYLREGEVVDIPGPDLFDHRWPYEVEGIGLLEMYPNRDSLGYIDTYGLKGIKNMFRGTIRYPGWCETLKALSDLGLMDDEEREWEPGTSYRDLLASFLPAGSGTLVERLAGHLGIDRDHDIVSRFEWAGLLSDRPLPDSRISPLNVLVHRFLETMRYRSAERDMILLRHEFIADYPDRPSEKIVSLFADFGVPGGDSAMSKTVSMPAAVATKLILEKAIELTGVHVPVLPELYDPVLSELEGIGVRFEEWTESLLPGPFDND
jgi:saccharopine dehydrogenase-like NADP-dependent oxidoreductase